MLKGLILKDVYSIRFQLIAAFLLTLFPNLMIMLAGGGMSVADAEDSFFSAAEMELMSVFIYGMVNYINITIFSSFLLNTLGDDVNSGWVKMQRTMPISGTAIIGGKIAATLVIIGALVVISLIFNILGSLLFGIGLEFMIAIPLCCGCLQIVTICPLFPVSMKIGTKFSTALYVGMVIVFAIVMLLLILSTLSSDIPETAMRLIAYAGLPAAALAALGVSFALGKRSCEADI